MLIILFQVNLVSAVDIYEDDEPELLLCYNRRFIILQVVSYKPSYETPPLL